MTVLTVLQEQLAEAHGLAMAATAVTREIEDRVSDVELRLELARMRREADETRARCLQVEAALGEELAAGVLARANTTKERAGDLMVAWLKAGTSPLRAWSFLAMGEAGEVAAWSALGELAGRDGDGAVAALARWALPVQERHLRTAVRGAKRLAGLSDPAGPRWG